MKRTCLVLGAILVFVAAGPVRAAFVPAADVLNPIQAALGLPANTTIGFSFTVGPVATPINALALDSGRGFVNTPMNVHIWQAGTAVDVAQANISNANPLSADGRYFYKTIAPVILLPNATYDIGVDLPFFNRAPCSSALRFMIRSLRRSTAELQDPLAHTQRPTTIT